MRATIYSLALLFTLAIPASPQTRIDAISTTFRWFGPNDKIVVERYDDPEIANVSCSMSRADTGGIKGGLGLAEDPSRFSIACRAVGPIAVPPGLPKVRGDRIRLGLAVFQVVPNPSRIRRGEECAGLHRCEHETDQWLAVQQHQRRAGGSPIVRRCRCDRCVCLSDRTCSVA